MPELVRNIVTNRRARHHYHLHDRFEAGIALLGSEVKSLRAGKANLQEGYVRLDPEGAWLVGCHISQYTHANRLNHEPLRERRLLLHHRELHRLRRGTREKGMTIVPLRLYFKGSLVKVELALAKGKRLHDKRQAMKARDAKREMDRRR
jgi:SsrA-binding protein